MSIERELKEQIKSLPSRQLSESRRKKVMEEARRLNSQSGRKPGYKLVNRAGSAAAAIVLSAATVGGMFYYHKENRIQQINSLFAQTQGGSGSTASVSPMDTPQFRKVLKEFLGTHSFSSSSSSSITVSANAAKNSIGGSSSESMSAAGSSSTAASNITHLVIRWSQIKDQYGYAFCTYLKNHGKHLADVVAEKDSNNNWRIVMKSLSPKLTTPQLERYKYFLSPGFGGSLPKHQYEFILFNGLVLDPAITQVVITLHNGSRITIPVQNRAYGYVQVQSQPGPQSGADAAPTQYGYKTLQGYNAQGKLVYSFG